MSFYRIFLSPIKQSADGLKTAVSSESPHNNWWHVAVRAKIHFPHKPNGGSFVADK